MTIERSEDLPQRSTASLMAGVARHYLGGRRSLIIRGASALVLGLALNWGWLVAAGIAPLLLMALPCAAMCALGLCMNKMGRSSEQEPSSQDITPEAPARGMASPRLVASGHAEPTAGDQTAAGKTGSRKDSCC
jgi:hypothetical protein